MRMQPVFDKAILSVQRLLSLESLEIPGYQRPYKWTLKNISELFADIDSHRDKSAYRLGSVVFNCVWTVRSTGSILSMASSAR